MIAEHRPSRHRFSVGLAELPGPLRRYSGLLEPAVAVVGILAFLVGTVPEQAARHGPALTLICLAVAGIFAVRYAIAVRQAPAGARLRRMLSAGSVVDLLAAAPVPVALVLGAPDETARLFGVLWSLQLVRANPAFVLLGRVLHNERQSLASVTLTFTMVILFVATAAYVAESGRQPDAFGSVPAALWWAMTTVTTTGYGDKVPVSFAGRVLGGVLMVGGIGLFALWAGILATGFAQEIRRSEFLKTWDLVVRLPLFRDLGAPALSDITRLLKPQKCAPGAVVVREGEAGDSMYFIAEGEVEVRAGPARVSLGAGQFFGEMALVSGAPRNATVVATAPSRLLRLDVVDFRELASRQPELLGIIEKESLRRAGTIRGP